MAAECAGARAPSSCGNQYQRLNRQAVDKGHDQRTATALSARAPPLARPAASLVMARLQPAGRITTLRCSWVFLGVPGCSWHAVQAESGPPQHARPGMDSLPNTRKPSVNYTVIYSALKPGRAATLSEARPRAYPKAPAPAAPRENPAWSAGSRASGGAKRIRHKCPAPAACIAAR